MADPRVARWEKEGKLELSGLLKTLFSQNGDGGTLLGPEKAYEEFFDNHAESDENDTLVTTQEKLVEILLCATPTLSPALRSTLKTGYRTIVSALHYLSYYPLPALDGHFTSQTLRRALMFFLPDEAYQLYGAKTNYRPRTEANHCRLLFQSMAAERESPIMWTAEDEMRWRQRAHERARRFPEGSMSESLVDEVVTNRDDHGDELYFDILETVNIAQPWTPNDFPYGPVRMNEFRPLATRFHQLPRLHNLVLSREKLRDVVLLSLALRLQAGCSEQEQLATGLRDQLESASRAIIGSFMQEGELDLDFERFEDVSRERIPRLFESIFTAVLYILMGEPPLSEVDSSTAFNSQVMSKPQLAELRCLLHWWNGAYEDFQLSSSWESNSSDDDDDSCTAAGLLAQLRAKKSDCLLFVSGVSLSTSSKVIFGFYSPSPCEDELTIQALPALKRGGSYTGAMLIQLDDVTDHFPGIVGRSPTFSASGDGGIRFGNAKQGVCLDLGIETGVGRFLHRSSVTSELAMSGPVFRETESRGHIDYSFTLNRIELWNGAQGM